MYYATIDAAAVISTWPLDAVNASSDMYDAALHLQCHLENTIHPSQLLLLLLLRHPCYSSSSVSQEASAPPERRSRLCLVVLVEAVLYLDDVIVRKYDVPRVMMCTLLCQLCFD